MDSDATIVLIISLLITFVNIVFICSVFVFFCCCIDVIDLKRKSRNLKSDNDLEDLEPLNSKENANTKSTKTSNL